MSVKPSRSGSRVLAALEQIALHQPVGVSELARLLGDNIAAAQRAIATLAGEGYIRLASARSGQWELTAQIHTIAQHAYGNNDLRRRARPALEELWRETGESVLLNVPDGGRFVVIDVLESQHYLRTAPPVGMIIPTLRSSTARAILPHMQPAEQLAYLGAAPDAEMLADFHQTIAQGYAISEGDVVAGSTNIAAPILEFDRRPVGAVLISAPADRALQSEYARLGAMVLATARKLSRGQPEALNPA